MQAKQMPGGNPINMGILTLQTHILRSADQSPAVPDGSYPFQMTEYGTYSIPDDSRDQRLNAIALCLGSTGHTLWVY